MTKQSEWDAYWAEVDRMSNRYSGPSRREQLREENRTIHKTIMLHFDGIDALTKRRSEIEAELAAIDEQVEVAR